MRLPLFRGMKFSDAKGYIKKLNVQRYWCGGTNTWKIKTHARLVKKDPERCDWSPYIQYGHINQRHWEFNLLRWHISICRQFLKIHTERIDGTKTITK